MVDIVTAVDEPPDDAAPAPGDGLVAGEAERAASAAFATIAEAAAGLGASREIRRQDGRGDDPAK